MKRLAPKSAESNPNQESRRATPKTTVKVRKPRKGSKAEAILTLTTTTPATPSEIAESVNCSKPNVTQTLQRYGIEPNIAESFKDKRAQILVGLQEKIARKLNIDGIKITTAKELQSAITGFGILFDKERLETGNSTENVNVLVAGLKDLQARRWGKSGGDPQAQP